VSARPVKLTSVLTIEGLELVTAAHQAAGHQAPFHDYTKHYHYPDTGPPYARSTALYIVVAGQEKGVLLRMPEENDGMADVIPLSRIRRRTESGLAPGYVDEEFRSQAEPSAGEALIRTSERIESWLGHVSHLISRKVAGVRMWINTILCALSEMPPSPWVDRCLDELVQLEASVTC